MKTTTETQLEAAMQKVKGILAQIIQAAAQDIAALTAADVGAVPTGRKVNGKALSSDINLTASDVGAAASSHTHVSEGSVTIPTTGWGNDNTAAYPKYYDIAVSGVTIKDAARVDIAPAAMGTAVACGMCPACETLAGKIRIRAALVPAAVITAQYWVEKGA